MSIVTHNMLASFSSRQLNITTEKKAKASEKLASGYRINRSADDAAGLSISEKMRAQVRGLKRASNNSAEGVSMIQVADGALNEMHDVLQRMNELAVQAANDVNQDIDRQAIQQEMDQLRGEINRISNATLFNDRQVLRVPQLVEISGDVYTEASMNQQIGITLRNGALEAPYGVAMDFKNVTADNLKELIGKSFSATCSQNCDQTFTFEFTDANVSESVIDGKSLTVKIGINDPAIKSGKDVVEAIMGQVEAQQGDLEAASGTAFNSNRFHIGHANGIAANDTQLVMYSIGGKPPYSAGMGLVKANSLFVEETNIYLQIGATEGQDLEYTIKTINAETLKLNKIDVSNHEKATNALTQIQDAINTTSEYRSYLGAMQNRLEHVIANLDNMAENTQAAESKIRDTDMAAEMVNLSKENILSQVGESMLAQANKATQGILSLLQ